MSEGTKFDVITLGHTAIDYLAIVPGLPELDTKMTIAEFSRQGGGPAATGAVTAARLGARTAYVGQVGDDDFAEFMLSEFAREGVDVSRTIRRQGAASQFSFIMVDQQTGKRTILWTRSDLPPLDPDTLDRDFITSCKVLHLDRHEVRAGIRAAQWVRAEGGIVSLDAGTYFPEVDELLPLVDVLIASQIFAAGSIGSADPMECARALLRGRLIAGVTCGENGSYFAVSDGAGSKTEFHVPAFKVPVVDTTGAGDVYHGAFAFGLSQGWDAEQCARLASAVAAIKCTKLGGRAGIPNREQAEALMSTL